MAQADNPPSPVPLIGRFKKILPQIMWIALVAFTNFALGCSYYKVSSAPVTTATLEQAHQEQRYIILHDVNQDTAWHLKYIVVNEETQQMSGLVAPLSNKHFYYKITDPKAINRFNRHKGHPVNEIHIFLAESTEISNSEFSVPLSAIERIEVYDPAVGSTVASFTIVTLGVGAALLLVLVLIALATKSSCPFVYINNGQDLKFTGEMFSGAIYSSLERDDYMPLPGLAAADGQYQLKIANELLERQYINLAELMVVEHPAGSEVLLDKYGAVQSLAKLEAPLQAASDGGQDFLPAVASKDSSFYLFNDDSDPDKDFSNLTLTFKKPLNAQKGKLVLNGKNSCWLDYAYGKFTQEFGTYYNKFAEKQKKVPADKNIQWTLEQGIPLSVYVKTQDGWEFIDYFDVVGPLATRDIVMPIDLSKIPGDEVKIKLECGFMFWEIDYAAMDFSEDIPVTVSSLSPSSAIDEKGQNVSAAIQASDAEYLAQPEIGNEAVMQYKAMPSKENYTQTAFLHSRGYYEYIRNYTNKPNFIYLNSFKKEGAFTRFSKQHYNEFIRNKKTYLTLLNPDNAN